MTFSQDEWLERIWDGLLSRQAARIRATYAELDDASRREVLNHLQRMVTEEGWHPQQVKSARAALRALQSPAARRDPHDNP